MAEKGRVIFSHPAAKSYIAEPANAHYKLAQAKEFSDRLIPQQ